MAHERKRLMTGRVSKNKMEKSVVVEVERRVPDPRYGKIVTRRSRFHAHDETNECNVGDLVEIREHRPISKTKRWVVVRVITKAMEV
ncbi:MAG: 30S ribosomal protein S17 [Proteobacteria bacterium]|jgi:small subunit ribosomal protein S17|nr:30S ribosomal protein S17 [Pseudomonadota bacterium]NLN61629.1 30S ribosomal protein S17 [Myxococcales bacterium]